MFYMSNLMHQPCLQTQLQKSGTPCLYGECPTFWISKNYFESMEEKSHEFLAGVHEQSGSGGQTPLKLLLVSEDMKVW